MSYCSHCEATVKGDWSHCPLCQTTLVQKDSKDSTKEQNTSFPNIPLRFNREKALQSFLRYSLVIVLFYFIVQYFWTFEFFGLEYVILGLMVTWTNIVFLVRKRRNLAKAINYILFFVSIVSIYMDYLRGWRGWSITFVVPILSISSLIAISISIRVVRLKVEDYVLYLQLAAMVGIVPLVFLLMGWTGDPLPSIVSVVFSFSLFVFILIRYRRKVMKELQKRMHI